MQSDSSVRSHVVQDDGMFDFATDSTMGLPPGEFRPVDDAAAGDDDSSVHDETPPPAAVVAAGADEAPDASEAAHTDTTAAENGTPFQRRCECLGARHGWHRPDCVILSEAR